MSDLHKPTFLPDPKRAEFLSHRMRSDLGSSLEHLCESARGHMSFDEAGLARLIDDLKAGARCGPEAFAEYFDLADALLEKNFERAAACLSELAQVRCCHDMPVANPVLLGTPPLEKNGDRFARIMEAGSESDIGILVPDADEAAEFIQRYWAAIELLERACPEILAEYRAFISQLIVVSGDAGREAQFDGGSHFRLWGAIFLNMHFHPTPAAVAEVIAHETGHTFLFSHYFSENVVLNTREAKYQSPLRVDPRPMEGIYHATFVSARMHYTMARLAGSGLLNEDELAEVNEAMELDVDNFWCGYHVVAKHGDLSPTGQALMDSARAYMETLPESAEIAERTLAAYTG